MKKKPNWSDLKNTQAQHSKKKRNQLSEDHKSEMDNWGMSPEDALKIRFLHAD